MTPSTRPPRASTNWRFRVNSHRGAHEYHSNSGVPDLQTAVPTRPSATVTTVSRPIGTAASRSGRAAVTAPRSTSSDRRCLTLRPPGRTSIYLFDFTMQRFDAKLMLHCFNKSQTANRNCFGPANVSYSRIALERVFYR
jgi:hypothetical protein